MLPSSASSLSLNAPASSAICVLSVPEFAFNLPQPARLVGNLRPEFAFNLPQPARLVGNLRLESNFEFTQSLFQARDTFCDRINSVRSPSPPQVTATTATAMAANAPQRIFTSPSCGQDRIARGGRTRRGELAVSAQVARRRAAFDARSPATRLAAAKGPHAPLPSWLCCAWVACSCLRAEGGARAAASATRSAMSRTTCAISAPPTSARLPRTTPPIPWGSAIRSTILRRAPRRGSHSHDPPGSRLPRPDECDPAKYRTVVRPLDQAEAEARGTDEREADIQNRLEGQLIREIGADA